MSTYAIGDLHGCHAEFVSLLEKLRFNPAQDRLWLVGDLINRGPGSLACLMEAKALGGGRALRAGQPRFSFAGGGSWGAAS